MPSYCHSKDRSLQTLHPHSSSMKRDDYHYQPHRAVLGSKESVRVKCSAWQRVSTMEVATVVHEQVCVSHRELVANKYLKGERKVDIEIR